MVAPLLVPKAHAQVDSLRVMHYNIMNYGNNAVGCNATTNGLDKKDTLIRRIVQYAQPDVISFNEVNRAPVLQDRLLLRSLNVGGVSSYAKAPFSNLAGSSIVNGLFYNATKLGLKSHRGVAAVIRDLDHYRLYLLPQPGETDTVFLNVIVSHLKAGNTTADQVDRAAQMRSLNAYLRTQDTSEAYIYQGDFNVYRSTELAYMRMVRPDSGGFFLDPLNRPGAWSANASFADVHTQSPYNGPSGQCFAAGGLDDRFDQQLINRALLDPTRRLLYNPAAFRPIGQDGRHFNQAVNQGTNNSAPVLVISAILNNSDHLPILGKLAYRRLTGVRQATATTMRAYAAEGKLHVAGLAAGGTAAFYSITGTLLGQASVADGRPAALPAGMLPGSVFVVRVLPEGGALLPATLRIVAPLHP